MNPQTTARPLDFGVIGKAFNIVKESWQPFVLAGLFSAIALGVTFAIFYTLMIAIGVVGGDRPGTMFAILPLMLLMFLVVMVLTSMIQAGMTHMGLKAVRGEALQATDIFMPLRNPIPYLVASILVSIASMLGIIACFVGAYVVAGLSMFVFPLMIDRKLSPVDAFKASLQMLKSQWLLATCFYFVVMLVGQIGAYACYVGLFFTLPIAYVAIALAYTDLSQGPSGEDSPITPWIDVPSANAPSSSVAPEPESATTSEPEVTAPESPETETIVEPVQEPLEEPEPPKD